MSKGQVSSGFNYIFALVIGGIIFMFFIGFAYKFMGFAGSLSAGELVNALDDEFSAFAASDSAEKSIELTKESEFKVFEGQLLSGGMSRDINHMIYSPFEVKGRELFIATKSLELPYRIGNVFYIADGRTIYILVYDSNSESIVGELTSSYNAIPTNFPTQTVSVNDLSNVKGIKTVTDQYENVRFVFFTRVDEYVEGISQNFESYEIIEISSSLDDYSYGEVTFSSGDSSIYLGYPMLIGAMISDYDAYNYNLNSLFEKMGSVTSVYYDKARFLSVRLPECDYAGVQSALTNYQNSMGDTLYSSYIPKMEAVNEANEKLGGDCPEIF
jgi:hypothetical protein